MDILTIAQRTAEGLLYVDAHTQTINQNRRTKEEYFPGAPNLREPQFVAELLSWWRDAYPADFCVSRHPRTEFPFPGVPATCDLVFCTPGYVGPPDWEWAVEYKYIRLVGNNGKNNDYGLAKAISPYRKDRSFTHDMSRLRANPIARHSVGVIYGFEYDESSIQVAAGSGTEFGRDCAKNIRMVLRGVDPVNLEYSLEPLQRIVDNVLEGEGLTASDCATVVFEGASRHPCGGKGRVVAWKIGE